MESANGFDHVAFTLFVELPGRSGRCPRNAVAERIAPGRHALALPSARAWLVECIVFSGGGRIGGTPRAGSRRAGAGIAVDAERDSVTFILPASALGNLRTLSGARVHVTTWDYDGGYRALAARAPITAFRRW
jgi:hypothetical protein